MRFGTWRQRPFPVAALAWATPLLIVAALIGMTTRSNALWRVVNGLCVPHMRLTGRADPCMKADLARGYVILKDFSRPTQLLLIPTTRLSGIEDPRLLAGATANYWEMSWENRALLAQRAGRPLRRDEFGFAINSIYGRTQNQLHIHIDCVDPRVARTLAAYRREIGPQWRPLKSKLSGRLYEARWISQSALSRSDPFKLLALRPEARATMDRQTLVMIGAVSSSGEPGFVLLNDQADLDAGASGHGEELLDHACAASDTALPAFKKDGDAK